MTNCRIVRYLTAGVLIGLLLLGMGSASFSQYGYDADTVIVEGPPLDSEFDAQCQNVQVNQLDFPRNIAYNLLKDDFPSIYYYELDLRLLLKNNCPSIRSVYIEVFWRKGETEVVLPYVVDVEPDKLVVFESDYTRHYRSDGYPAPVEFLRAIPRPLEEITDPEPVRFYANRNLGTLPIGAGSRVWREERKPETGDTGTSDELTTEEVEAISDDIYGTYVSEPESEPEVVEQPEVQPVVVEKDEPPVEIYFEWGLYPQLPEDYYINYFSTIKGLEYWTTDKGILYLINREENPSKYYIQMVRDQYQYQSLDVFPGDTGQAYNFGDSTRTGFQPAGPSMDFYTSQDADYGEGYLNGRREGYVDAVSVQPSTPGQLDHLLNEDNADFIRGFRRGYLEGYEKGERTISTFSSINRQPGMLRVNARYSYFFDEGINLVGRSTAVAPSESDEPEEKRTPLDLFRSLPLPPIQHRP